MLKILVSDDIILFIEHIVSFCACAMDITKYFKRAIFSILTSQIFKAAKHKFVFRSLNVGSANNKGSTVYETHLDLIFTVHQVVKDTVAKIVERYY